MHFNTRNNDQLLLQHPPVSTNSYERCAFSYTTPTVWNEFPDSIRNAPSVMSFKKQLKTYYFGNLLRPPDGYVMSCPEVLQVLTLPDMWILTLINVSGFVSRFWVRVHQIRVHEIKAYTINHLLILLSVTQLVAMVSGRGSDYPQILSQLYTAGVRDQH